MSSTRVDADTASATEILERLKEGGRITIELGDIREATLRRSGETFYCDDGIRLITYRSLEGMRQCLEDLGIGGDHASAER